MTIDRAALPTVTLVRHGETEWTKRGRHTGRTDIPLTEAGRESARILKARLSPGPYALILASPSSRAQETARLAGFGDALTVDPDLAEWDYGAFEGRTTNDIRAEWPGWQIFRDGCPDGETAAEVGARADRVIARLRAADAPCLVFSSAHLLRTLGARWIGLAPEGGALLALDTASISALGYDHDLSEPVIKRWNDMVG